MQDLGKIFDFLWASFCYCFINGVQFVMAAELTSLKAHKMLNMSTLTPV